MIVLIVLSSEIVLYTLEALHVYTRIKSFVSLETFNGMGFVTQTCVVGLTNIVVASQHRTSSLPSSFMHTFLWFHMHAWST